MHPEKHHASSAPLSCKKKNLFKKKIKKTCQKITFNLNFEPKRKYVEDWEDTLKFLIIFMNSEDIQVIGLI